MKIPAGAEPPFTVFINGVEQSEGDDYDVEGGEIVFTRPIVKEKIGTGRWLAMYLGLFGTYRKDETVDLQFQRDGKTELVSDLPVVPYPAEAQEERHVNIGFLLLTDYTEAVNGKLYLTGGGWNVLRLPELPHEWAFHIGLGIDVAWHETNSPHELVRHHPGPRRDRARRGPHRQLRDRPSPRHAPGPGAAPGDVDRRHRHLRHRRPPRRRRPGQRRGARPRPLLPDGRRPDRAAAEAWSWR